MTIHTLPPELEQYIEQEIAQGNFASEGDLLRDAVRLHRQRKLHELRKQIESGLQDLEGGDIVECADDAALRAFFEQLKSHL